MGKNKEKNETDTNKVSSVQSTDVSDDLQKKEALQEKVEDKKDEAISKGADSQKIQNIIGEIKPPDDLDDKKAVKAYMQEVSKALGEVLAWTKARDAKEAEKEAKDTEIEPEAPKQKLDHFGFPIEYKFLE